MSGKKKVPKGQKSIDFFCTPVVKESNKENMGLDSNLRKSAIRKAKEHSYPKKNSQRKINGEVANGRCDEGTKVCKACDWLVKKGKKAKFAHDPTCPKNSNYKNTNGGRIALHDYHLMMYEQERAKKLNAKPTGNELHSGDITQDDVDEFFSPPPLSCGDKKDLEGCKVLKGSAADIYSNFDQKKMITRINHYVKNPTYYMKRGKSVPEVVRAGIQSLLDLLPIRCKKGTNELLGMNNKNSITYKKLQAYKKQFPPGTVGYTFPRANKSLPPDHNYCQLEGRTIYFLAWEINIPGWQPTCFECGDTMTHDQYDFQSHGHASPVFDITGVTNYCVSMTYECKNCKNRVKSSDGRILMQVDPHYRRGFNVDPRYAVNKQTYLSQSFTRVMDKMFITYGNGEQLSTMLNELRADHLLDLEEDYFNQAIASGSKVLAALPTFEQFIGRYSPTGEQLRHLKDEAAYSKLVSTGVSDAERSQREIQSVGCTKNSASDHTFALKLNYAPGLLPENACGHTIGNNDGEIASIGLVPDTKQIHYAHQAEQCTLRSNWEPKCHTTDNCPNGIAFWQERIRGVHCQLGLFHYMYRITKTINKECSTWKTALASLQGCMYCYEGTDLEKVKEALRDGTLGKVNGHKCKEANVEAKAKTYRDYVRVWVYDEQTIQKKLRNWIQQYRDECDDSGEFLFTKYTEKTVLEQMKKAQYVVDRLSKDELYLEVKPNVRSETGLSTFIGARGTESKLEKGHHAIAHFANGGMRHTLADYLGLAGIALYNLRIRYRLKIAKMKPKLRADIPVAFQSSPHYTNHLRLSHNNKLAKQAGWRDIHCGWVEVLQPDTGERFLYQYYLQEMERKKNLVGNDPSTNRCLCRDCGKVNNPYRKRKPRWDAQQDQETTNSPTPTILPTPAPLLLAPKPTTLQPLVSLVPIAYLPYSQLMQDAKKKKKSAGKKQL